MKPLFKLSEKLKIGFIIGGKIYNDIKTYVDSLSDEEFYEYSKGENSWIYCEFANIRKSWTRFWRTIYAKPITGDDGQFILEFERPETIIYTNLGMDNEITRVILELKKNIDAEISPQALINTYHLRARDKLVNRAFKDFGTEHLPFKSFIANAAYYYLMAISFFLFESFKYDIESETVSIHWYATTFRRKVLDFAGKIIYSSRQIVLKITESAYEALGFSELWANSIAHEKIPITPA